MEAEDQEAELLGLLLKHWFHDDIIERDESVKILKLLLGNLIKFPGEEKYQKLAFGRVLNKVVSVTSGLPLLLACGWQKAPPNHLQFGATEEATKKVRFVLQPSAFAD